MKKILAIIASLPFTILTASANSHNLGVPCNPYTEICNPIGSESFTEILGKIYNFVFLVSAAIVPIMILWGALFMLTSGGDEGKFKKGKEIIMWTIIGFGVVILSGGVAKIIQDFLK